MGGCLGEETIVGWQGFGVGIEARNVAGFHLPRVPCIPMYPLSEMPVDTGLR